MDKTTEELELEDGSAESETVTETDADDADGADSQESEKKKKSTSQKFKELHKKAKLADELQKELEEAKAELEQWRSENPELVKDYFTKKEWGTLEKRLFLVENPEAKEHIEAVEARATKYNMPFEEAWEDVKLRLPKESQSKDEFSFKGKQKSKTVDLKSLSAEEALELTPEKRKEWRKIHGFYGNN